MLRRVGTVVRRERHVEDKVLGTFVDHFEKDLIQLGLGLGLGLGLTTLR